MNLSQNSLSSEIIIDVYDKEGNLKETRNLPTNYNAPNIAEIKRFDENNNEVEKVIVPMKSFTRNYMNGIYSAMTSVNAAGTYYYSYTQSNASVSNYNSPITFDKFSNGMTNYQSSAGIVVGKNMDGISSILSSSVLLTDYNLKNRITNGTLSGSLLYADSIYRGSSYTGSFYKISQARLFSNVSTVTCSIKEIGAVSEFDNSYGTFDYSILMARDIYDDSGNAINIDVAPNQTVYVEYNYLLDTSSLFPNLNWMKLREISAIGTYSTPLTYINNTGIVNSLSYRKGIINRTSTALSFNNTNTFNYLPNTSGYEMYSPGYSVSSLYDSIELFTDGNWWLRCLRNATLGAYPGAWFSFLGRQIRDWDITYLINAETTASYAPALAIRQSFYADSPFSGLHISFISSSLVVYRITSDANNAYVIESSSAKTFESNINYYMRFYASHSAVKAKAWQSGTVEPAWDIEYNTSVTQSGTVAIYQFPSNTMGVQASKYFWYNDFNFTYLEYDSSSIKNTAMNSYNCGASSYHYEFQRMFCNTPTNRWSSGIVVGSNDYTQSNSLISNQQASFTDFRLNNIIPTGTGSGEVVYGDSNVTYTETSISSSYLEIYRPFTNLYSNQIIIREAGLYLSQGNSANNSVTYVLNNFAICVGRVLTGADLILNPTDSATIRFRLYLET